MPSSKHASVECLAPTVPVKTIQRLGAPTAFAKPGVSSLHLMVPNSLQFHSRGIKCPLLTSEGTALNTHTG